MTRIWDWLCEMLRRVSFRTRRSSLDEQLREEMQFHLEMLTRDNEARGMSPTSAREAARRQFGSSTMLREASRMHWSLGWIDAIWQDVRYGVRSLMRTPGITLTALATLTLGMGATTTVVALVDATLLHPIALRDVDRIVTICQTNTGSDCQQLAPGNYISIRDAHTVFKDVALAQGWSATVAGRTMTTVANGFVVTPNYFSVMGITPVLGRSFTQSDADASASRPTVVILSHAFWQRQFNADPGVIGRKVLLNGVPLTVVGVLGRRDGFPTYADMWGPLHLAANAASNRASVSSLVFGRLRPGSSAGDAARDVSAIQQELARESPGTNKGWRFITLPLKKFHTADIRPSVLLILGAVIGVLLIACANVGNLLLVRAASREREIAVCAALGAGRAQIARQLIIEGLLLSLAGGLFGAVMGQLGIILFKRSVPTDLSSFLPGFESMHVNWYVLMLMLGVCVLVGIGFSAFPAFRAARTDLTDAMKQGARGAAGSIRIARVRSVLVVSEIALALILVTGAALLVQSFNNINSGNTGLKPDHVLTMSVTLPATLDADQARAFHGETLRRLEALPSVKHVALIDLLPLSNNNNGSNFIPDSRPTLQLMQAPVAHDEVITPDYFNVMSIPLVSGRGFNDSDTDSTASVIIVNRTLANRFWPNGDALGHTVRMGYQGHNQYTIVGVVGDVRYDGADEPPGPEIYHPMHGRLWTTDVAIQTAGDPAAFAQTAMTAIRAMDPSVAVTRVLTMDAMMARHNSYYKILADGLAIFALIALVIAASGIYGVVSYGVAQRTQEIGVRMALGAKYHTVVRMVLVDGARMATIGVVLGIIGAWFTGKTLAFLLYGVAPRDPVTLIVVALILGAVALAASYFPARRAGRVEPVVALRYE